MSVEHRKSPHRTPLRPDRIRRTDGGFAFIPNRFLHAGFFASLGLVERSLYFFLVLAGDRCGVSYYAYDRICAALEITPDDYLQARNALIALDLIAFDGSRYQVLSLPPAPVVRPCPPLLTASDFEDHDPATIRGIIRASLPPRR